MTMKVLTMVRLVLIPARLAASGFPPMEKTYRPKRSRFVTKRHDEGDSDQDQDWIGDPERDLKAAFGDRDVVLLGVLEGQVLGQVVAVHHPHRPEHHGAAQDAENDVEPHRAETKAELATTTTTHDEEGNDSDTGDSPTIQLPVSPNDPLDPPPRSWKVASIGAMVRPLAVSQANPATPAGRPG